MKKRFSLEELNNVSEIDIVYKRKINCKVSERPQINTPRDGYEIFLHYWNEDKIELIEEFKVLYLNRSNRVLQIVSLSQGGITGTIADPRLILAGALKVAATAILLGHNHPAGSLKPSVSDVDLTKKIKNAGLFHDITLIDHIIITSEGYLSFAEEGFI